MDIETKKTVQKNCLIWNTLSQIQFSGAKKYIYIIIYIHTHTPGIYCMLVCLGRIGNCWPRLRNGWQWFFKGCQTKFPLKVTSIKYWMQSKLFMQAHCKISSTSLATDLQTRAQLNAAHVCAVKKMFSYIKPCYSALPWCIALYSSTLEVIAPSFLFFFI